MNLLTLIHQDVELKRTSSTNGGEYHGKCPLCGGKDRFTVWPQHHGKLRFWCRQCNAHGDIYDYLQLTRGMAFVEAKKYLGEPIISLPKQTTAPPKGPAQLRSAVWSSLARNLVRQCERRLWSPSGEKALAYLHESRHLSDRTIYQQHLGYNKHECLFGSGPARVSNGISIPWFCEGEVTAINIRRPGGKPKYRTVGGSRKELFYIAGSTQTLVVVEGEFDAMLLAQELCVSTAATGSASTISESLFFLALAYPKIYILPDGDLAGSAMAEKWRSYKCFSSRLKVLRLSAHDATDFVSEGGDLADWWHSIHEEVPDWILAT